MRGVTGSFLSWQISSTCPVLLLIVPSLSKSHSWLAPPLGLEMITFLLLPCCTSSTNLDTKIPHFNIFLVLGNVNQFALSHWFSYCLHECMNEWMNGSLLIWTTALKWGTPSCGMCSPEVWYKWDVSEEPTTLWRRQSASPKTVIFLPDYAVSHFLRYPSYRPLWELW